MLLCLILGLVRFYHRGEKCEKRGSTRGRRSSKKRKKRLKEGEGEAQIKGRRSSKKQKKRPNTATPQAKSHQPSSQKRRKPKPKAAKAQGEAEGREKQQKPPFWAVFRPASGSSPAQPHHTIKGNEEQQPHSQPHPALQGRHSVVRTGENGYSSVITSAASRIACSSASESLVRGMSISGVHSPRVCIITFSAVRDWPSERPAWYSFAISFVSS